MASTQQSKRRVINKNAGQTGELPSNRSVLLLIGLLVAAFFVFNYLERINELAAVRAQIVTLQRDLAQAEQRNAELEATRLEVAGAAYVAEAARSELGLILPGDDPFVILGQPAPPLGTQNGAEAAGLATQPPATEADLFNVAWWRSLFGLQ